MGVLRYTEPRKLSGQSGLTFTLQGNLQDMTQVNKVVLKMPGYLGSTLALSPPTNSGTITAHCNNKEDWRALLKKLGRHFILTVVEDTK